MPQLKIFFTLCLCLIVGSCVFAQDDIVLRVGDHTIDLGEYETRYYFYLYNLTSQRGIPLDDEAFNRLVELRPIFLDQLTTENAVYRVGRSLGFTPSEEFLDERLAEVEASLGGMPLAERLLETGVDEVMFRKLIGEAELSRRTLDYLRSGLDVPSYLTELYYHSLKESFQSSPEACAKHILVQTLEEAEAIRIEIAAGASFEQLAEARSLDPGSAANGGDLGCFELGMLVPNFEEVAFSQPLNEVSEVVQTDFGYHLILTYERREPTVPPLEDVSETLNEEIANDILRRVIEGYKTADDIISYPELVTKGDNGETE